MSDPTAEATDPPTTSSSFDIPLRCKCGHFRAKVQHTSPKEINHIKCNCKFCQSFARYLGRADELIDQWGGVDLFQIRPSRLVLTSGLDTLRCVHLTQNGARRFYTTCCQTPIANTLPTGKFPFLGLFSYAVDLEALTYPLEKTIGPILARINAHNPGHQRETSATRWHQLSMAVRFAFLLGKWWILSEQKFSPFFEANGQHIVSPERISIPKELR